MSFFDGKGDLRMAQQNRAAWESITQNVRDATKYLPRRAWDILDWGCHSGGLLEMLGDELGSCAKTLDGVEPDSTARIAATKRLIPYSSCLYVDLEHVSEKSIDVFVSHEVLYLVDLDWFITQLKRVLRDDGAAFVALGSHSENGAWMRWRESLLSRYGHASYLHAPLEIVEKGHAAGFTMGFDRLWPGGYPESNWYTPPGDGWGEFLSIREAIEFRESKYIFQFWKR